MDYIKKRPNIDRYKIIRGVLAGLAYLHGVCIVHGDVKGSNILINDNGEASLADYGVSRILERYGCTKKVPTPTWGSTHNLFHEDDVNPVTTDGWRWIACELMANGLEDDDDSISRATMATDVWAFSMTVVEILTGSIPFSHIKNDASVIFFVTSGGRPKRETCMQINNDIWAILEKCWDAKASRRPSMANVAGFFASQRDSAASYS